MTARENAKLVLHTVSAETATGRAARRAAEDVLRLENVRSAAQMVCAFEWPNGSYRSHPHPTGVQLWGTLHKMLDIAS